MSCFSKITKKSSSKYNFVEIDSDQDLDEENVNGEYFYGNAAAYEIELDKIIK